MVPAFLFSLYLTLYKTNTSLRRTLSAGPKGVRLRESCVCSFFDNSEYLMVECQGLDCSQHRYPKLTKENRCVTRRLLA